MDSVCDCESHGRDFLVSSETNIESKSPEICGYKGKRS